MSGIEFDAKAHDRQKKFKVIKGKKKKDPKKDEVFNGLDVDDIFSQLFGSFPMNDKPHPKLKILKKDDT